VIFKKKYKYTNIFHCTVHKAGSQWIRKMFTDPVIVSKTGLKHFQYQNLLPGGFDPRNIDERDFYLPFPEKTFCSPLYISCDNFKAIPTVGETKAFYISRNSRDLVISYYFSQKASHPLMGDIEENRSLLNELNMEDGLEYVIDHLEKKGYWRTIRSWENCTDPRIIKLDYTDLVEHPEERLSQLLSFLEISLTRKELNFILEKYSFKNMSGGRKIGETDEANHLRSGASNEWKKYWNEKLEEKFVRLSVM